MLSARTWRWVTVVGGFITLVLMALLTAAWSYRIWSWHDYESYRAMSRECHPVWQDLHAGRIRAGQDVDEVIASTEPVRVDRYGDFVQLNYQVRGSFTGVTIAAKGGRLASASAWSCAWQRPFFDELTSEDLADFNRAYEEHWRPIRQAQEAAEAAENAAAKPDAVR